MLTPSLIEANTITLWAREAFSNVACVTDIAALQALVEGETPALIVTDDHSFAAPQGKGAGLESAIMHVVPDLGSCDFSTLIESAADDFFVLPGSKMEFFLRTRRAIFRRSQLDAARPDARLPNHADPLTKALARGALLEAASELDALARREYGEIAAYVFDIKSLVRVNEFYGRAIGDKLLQAFCVRVAGAMKAGGSLGRTGGREFTILETLDPQSPLQDRCAQLLALVRTGFDIAGDTLSGDVSIGAAVRAANGEALEELVDRASAAANEAQPNCHHVLDGDAGPASHLAQDAEAFASALSGHQLRLHYQPQINLATGALAGIEALLRWERPGHGLLTPASFLPLAARAGQLGAVTEWVLRQASADVEAGRQRGVRLPRVSINVSAQEVADGRLQSVVEAMLRQTGLSADQLDIEAPFFGDAFPAAGRGAAEGLLRAGVSITLEAFGGQCSETFDFANAPVSRLKIDPEFLESARAALVASRALSAGLIMVASGVENPRQLAAARALGCVEAQGHYLGYPLPAAALFAAN